MEILQNETNAAIERLLAESEIRALIARYARGIDRCDMDLVRTCYHDGAVDIHGDDFSGGAEEFIEWVRQVLPDFEATMHLMGTQSIEIDGDKAWAETYAISLHRHAATDDEPANDHFLPVRYCDRLECRDGTWGIVHRVVVYEPGRVDVVTHDLAPVLGSRDRSDPSYNRD